MKYDFTTVYPNKEPVNPFIRMMGVNDPEVLPHGIAEMRFRLAPAIVQAMHQVVDEENFGYQPPDMAYTKAVVDWMKDRHHWDVEPQWICQTSGVVCAIGIAIRAYTQPGDKVLIQTPLYGPFRKMIEKNGRVVSENRLINQNGVYTIDFEDFAAKARESKLFLLCSPHNPTGRVWSQEELQRMAEICLACDLPVLSDEIHFDLTFQPHRVLPCAAPEIQDKCVICTAPSKTFNLAGCALSNIIIPGKAMRDTFEACAYQSCGSYTNTFGYAAAQAAYESGADWLEELKSVLRENETLVRTELARFLPGAIISPLEGTYLMWIDLRCLHMEQSVLMEFLEKKAHLFPNDGTGFGDNGKGFIRLNIACPTWALEKALGRLEAALREL